MSAALAEAPPSAPIWRPPPRRPWVAGLIVLTGLSAFIAVSWAWGYWLSAPLISGTPALH
jgi:hypothetical protein